jgi:hypothetical protein
VGVRLNPEGLRDTRKIKPVETGTLACHIAQCTFSNIYDAETKQAKHLWSFDAEFFERTKGHRDGTVRLLAELLFEEEFRCIGTS